MDEREISDIVDIREIYRENTLMREKYQREARWMSEIL